MGLVWREIRNTHGMDDFVFWGNYKEAAMQISLSVTVQKTAILLMLSSRTIRSLKDAATDYHFINYQC